MVLWTFNMKFVIVFGALCIPACFAQVSIDYRLVAYNNGYDKKVHALSKYERATCLSSDCYPGWTCCSNGPGCCPAGVACWIANDTNIAYCDLQCTAADIMCSDGGCCPSYMMCDTINHNCISKTETASTYFSGTKLSLNFTDWERPNFRYSHAYGINLKRSPYTNFRFRFHQTRLRRF